MDKDMELLHQKIDYLTEQVMLTRRRQQEMAELRQDFTPIATDIFKTAVEELNEVSLYFSYEDLIFLIKKLLRNTKNIIAILEKMESATDFIHDASPLSGAVFNSALEKLNEIESKGYFSFLKEAFAVIDRIVANFSAQDVRQLGDNIVLILNTVKQLTQPEMLKTMQNALAVYQNIDVKPPEKVSLLDLAKELNSPGIRRALATGLIILKNVSSNLEKVDFKKVTIE